MARFRFSPKALFSIAVLAIGFSSKSLQAPEFISLSLTEMAAATLGPEKAHMLFDGWGLQELSHLFSLYDQERTTIERKAQGRELSPGRIAQLKQEFDHRLFGVLGELLGGVLLKRQYGIETGFTNGAVTFMSENEYEKWNGAHPRPDGLIYSIEGEGLVIYRILESKLGRQRVSHVQTQKLLNYWREAGITIESKVYREFYIQVKNQQISVESVTLDEFGSAMAIFLSVGPDKRKPYHYLPRTVTERDLRRISRRFSSVFVDGVLAGIGRGKRCLGDLDELGREGDRSASR